MLVMKFGGTSVGCADSIARVCGIVCERLMLRPVVVVSAMARVTDELQSMGLLSRDGRNGQSTLSKLQRGLSGAELAAGFSGSPGLA